MTCIYFNPFGLHLNVILINDNKSPDEIYVYLFCGVVGKLAGVASVGPLPNDGPLDSTFLRSDVKLRRTS